MFNARYAHKKTAQKPSGQRKPQKPNAISTQSDVGCDCQQQYPFFIKYKWQPDSVIKIPHYPLSKPSNHFYLYAIMITEMGIKKQEKFPLSVASACG